MCVCVCVCVCVVTLVVASALTAATSIKKEEKKRITIVVIKKMCACMHVYNRKLIQMRNEKQRYVYTNNARKVAERLKMCA